jgi:hypothetical protein
MFVGWTIRTLAKNAKVYENTILFIEKGRHRGRDETLEALRTALEKAGVEFTNGKRPGVRQRSSAREL